jgi:Na+/melibiose symporter-like transporter
MAIVKKNWIPISRMNTINGLDQFAGTAGQLLGTIGVTSLIVFFGNWQNMMLALAIILTVVTALWIILYKDNPANPVNLSKNDPVLEPFKEALKEKSVWLLSLGWPGTTLIWIAFTTFWPTFATESLGLTLSQAGIAVGMIPVGSLIACLVSPPLTNAIGYDKLMIWPWGIVLCFAYFFGTQTSNIILLSATFFLGGFASFAFVPPAFTILFKLKTLSTGGTSMGLSMIYTIANIGGALAGIVVGKLIGIMELKTALMWCCLSPMLFVCTTLFLPELGRKAMEKSQKVAN